MTQNRTYRLENWSTEDLEYLGGSFAKGLDRQVATKEWLDLEADMPLMPEESKSSKKWEPAAGYETPATKSHDHRGSAFAETRIPDENTPVGGTGLFNHEPTKRGGRRDLHSGKAADVDAVKNTMPAGTWHVSKGWADERSLSDELLGRAVIGGDRWSEALTVCRCGNEIPEGRRKYCSESCSTVGGRERRNKRRRAGRKWPRDERGWYVQSRPPVRRRRLNVWHYDEHETAVTHTVSKTYRLRSPWSKATNVWKITDMHGRLAC